MNKLRSAARTSWLRAVGRYYRDPKASVLGKLVAAFAVVYTLVPIDLIPDVPVVGWLDDIGVMGLATAWLVRAVARYRKVPEPRRDLATNDDFASALPAGEAYRSGRRT